MIRFIFITLFIINPAFALVGDVQVAPDRSWSNLGNVPGNYGSGQAVCDARAELINYDALIYVDLNVGDEIPYDGKCQIPETDPPKYMASPGNFYYCPTDFDTADETVYIWFSTYSGRFKGHNAYYYYRYKDKIDHKKNLGIGQSQTCSFFGNPINFLTGNKVQVETDYQSAHAMPLEFTRYYNSMGYQEEFKSAHTFWPYPVGVFWRHTFMRHITLASNNILSTAHVYRPDGKVLYFSLKDNDWVGESDIDDRLTSMADDNDNMIGWQYITADDAVETYDANGRLTSIAHRSGVKQQLSYNNNDQLQLVTDSYGHSLQLSYDDQNRLAQLINPINGITTYGYDEDSNLASVTYPDGSTKTYQYTHEKYDHAMTGLIDENNNLYAT